MYSAIARNRRNTVIIILSFVGFFTGVSVWLSYVFQNAWLGIGIIAFVITYTTVQYFLASTMAIRLAGGVLISKKENPKLWNVVENLSISQGMKMPRVYVIDDESFNAFAAGTRPSNSLVAITSGLLKASEKFELQGVMAHEMAHLKNRDTSVTTLIFGLVGAFAALAQFCFYFFLGAMQGSGNRNNDERNQGAAAFAIVAGIFLAIIGLVCSFIAFVVGPIVTAGVSRQREFLADATGAQMTRHPEGLMSALRKIEAFSSETVRKSRATAAMYFDYPFKRGFFSRLLSTHPPTYERIQRLAEMSTGARF